MIDPVTVYITADLERTCARDWATFEVDCEVTEVERDRDDNGQHIVGATAWHVIAVRVAEAQMLGPYWQQRRACRFKAAPDWMADRIIAAADAELNSAIEDEINDVLTQEARNV